MSIILSHSGKQHSYHVAKALYELEQLEIFYTSSYITQQWLQKYFNKTNNRYFTRRFIDGLPGNKVNANWRFELKEILYRKIYGKTQKTQNAIYERDIKFDQFVSSQLTTFNYQPSNYFWGFQGSCFESLKAAKNMGIMSVCELATAHAPYAKKILGEEQALHPEWAESIDNLVFPASYEKRLNEEPHLARKVISASKFTTDSLIFDNVDPAKINYLPLGFDASAIPYNKQINKNLQNRPLKILYAGTVTQRKGIKYLLDAMDLLPKNDFELHIIGGIQGSGEAFRKYNNYTYHAPLNQQSLFRSYAEFDVFVLPSVFEGFGLVIVEAMAAGLPVITTTHTMGPEIIENDKNGYIVPIRDSKAIAESLEKLKNKGNEEFHAMQLAARQAALHFTWDVYSANLHSLLKKW
jgi:glycosyltransferase involved in cell wall biosynthesis